MDFIVIAIGVAWFSCVGYLLYIGYKEYKEKNK